MDVQAKNAEDGVREAEGRLKEAHEEVLEGLERGPIIDSVVSILTIIQLIAAIETYYDSNDHKPLYVKLTDIAGSLLLSIGTVASTTGRVLATANLTVDKLIKISRFVEWTKKLVKPLAIVGGVQTLIDGYNDLRLGLSSDEPDWEMAAEGGVEVTAGLCLVYGALTASSLATGAGEVAIVSVSIYKAYESYAKSSRKAPKVVLEVRLDELRALRPWREETAVVALGLRPELKAVTDALNKWDCIDLKFDLGLVERLEAAMCSKDEIDVLLAN